MWGSFSQHYEGAASENFAKRSSDARIRNACLSATPALLKCQNRRDFVGKEGEPNKRKGGIKIG
jgi:hypothetical protein